MSESNIPREPLPPHLETRAGTIIDEPRPIVIANAQISEYLAHITGESEPAADFMQTYDRFHTFRDHLSAYAVRNRGWGVEGLRQRYNTIETIEDDLKIVDDALGLTTKLTRVSSAIEADLESDYFGGEVKRILFEAETDETIALISGRSMPARHLEKIGGVIDVLALALLVHQGYLGKQWSVDISHSEKKPYAQPSSEMLTAVMQTKQALKSANQTAPTSPDDTLARNILETYEMWRDFCMDPQLYDADITRYGIPPQRMPETTEVISPPSPTAEEIATLQATHETAVDTYAQVVQAYRPPNRQLDKEDFRPTTTGLLRELRDTASKVTAPEAEDSAFAKRITGVLRRLAIEGAKPEETLQESMAKIASKEVSAWQTVINSYGDLATVGEAAPLPASLYEDFSWLIQNWTTLQPTVRAHWPGGAEGQATEAITASLKQLRTLRRLYEQDPRLSLYSQARHVGRVALPPEAKASIPERKSSLYKVARSDARQGLEAVLANSKDMQVRQRAAVLKHYLGVAERANVTTGNEAYGLYFAENAQESRDRYFIVRFRDEATDLDWFILETLEGERATYIMPLNLIHEMTGAITDPDEELDAMLAFSKADTRELGKTGNLRSQIAHDKGWDNESHIAEISKRIQAYRPS